MKYQFQFAGVNAERRVPPQKKRLRLIILIVAFALSVLAYANYLYSLAHGQKPFFAAIGHAASPPPPIPAHPAPVQSAPQLPAALKKVTEAGVASLGNYLSQAVKSAPVVPVTPVTPTAPPTGESAAKAPTATATADATGFQIISEQQVTHRPTRVRTPQERLLRAGQIAYGNVMEQVSKYPDAYGFTAEDSLSDAKLGEPIPVYTIEENDRAKYQAGQPIKPLLKPMNQWVFPVIVGNRICCMVQVNYTGRDYVPDKGSKLLGLAWNKILEKWPASQGFHPCLIVTQSVPGYYFTVPELPNQNLTDIVQMFYFHPTLSPADVILASWR